MSCFYLIASLPALTFMQEPSVTTDAFQALCEAQLGEKDAQAVGWLCRNSEIDGDAPRHPFVSRWVDREIQIRNTIARARAARRKTDASGSIRPHAGFDVVIDETVDGAFDLATPLEREQALDRLRWNVLDELAGVAPFSVSVVLAYAVKLRIAQRWAALDQQTALERIGNALDTADGKKHGNSDPATAKQQPPDAAVNMKAKL